MGATWHIPRRLTPQQVDALYHAQRAGDPVGIRIHEWFAIAACALGMGPTSVADFAALPLLICFLIRMTGRHPILEPLGRDPVFWATMAWIAWTLLSITWSQARVIEPGTKAWLEDVQSLRFVAILVPCLQPVLDRRGALTIAILVGLAIGQVTQILNFIDMRTQWLGLPFARDPSRISGWWDPVVGGSMLTAGLGMWLSITLFAASRRTWAIGLGGTATTLLSIAMTGTRGAWIAAAVLMPVCAAIALWRSQDKKTLCGRLGVLAVAGAVVIGAAWVTIGPSVRQRLNAAMTEVQGALDQRDFSSDTGLRIAMWKWAGAAIRTHPVFGLGSGGYQPWVRSQTREAAKELGAPFNPAKRVHAHAHSVYLHTWAVLGVIGLGVVLAMIGLAAWSGLRPADRPENAWLAYAPSLGLLGLGLAGVFDTVTLNQQTAYLLYVLVALCLWNRPRETGTPLLPVLFGRRA